MSRAFACLTAVGSAATFAGVWVASAPSPVVATSPAPVDMPSAAAATREPVFAKVATEPEVHVVRGFVGASDDRPLIRSGAAIYYPNCTAARAAGVAPIYRGEPGYREAMDRDSDGIACEPIRNR